MTNFRLALRQLLLRPGLAVIVVLTLALGIGANSGIFTLFHQVLLRPLPVPNPGDLVNLSSPGPRIGSMSCSGIGSCDQVFSYPMLRDLQREQQVFTGIAAHRGFTASIGLDGHAVSGAGLLVNGHYFGVLQLQPAVGRLIAPHDEPGVGEGQVVVLSHAWWQSEFGGDPAVLGRTLVINGHPLTIIGVAPEGFSGTTFGSRPQVFVPLTLRWLMEPYFPPGAEDRLSYWVYLFARLRPGISVERATSGINTLYSGILSDVEAPLNSRMSEQRLAEFKARKIELEPGRHGQGILREDARLPLSLLFCLTGLVLLIACVNIANLLLARGAARAGEMAIRASVGASQGQMILQLLTEAGLLGLLGCVASLPVAAATLGLVTSLVPAQLATSLPVELGPAAMAFAVGTTMLTVLLFGLFPALHATRVSPGAVLKGFAGRSGGDRGASRFRNVLVTAQIALSMVLLVLAGLFAHSLANLGRAELGMRIESVVTFSVLPVLNGYGPEQSRQLFDRVEEELAVLPGVSSVASSMVPLLAGSSWGGNVTVQGFDAPPDADRNARFNEVGTGFFRTMEIPLLAGREFSDADRIGAPRVAVVNESFARKFELGDRVVGARMRVGSGDDLDIEIIGLVGDSRYDAVKADVPPQYFLARQQNPDLGFMNFYLRTQIDPRDIASAIPRVVAALDPNLPVSNLSTLPDVVRDSVFLDRMIGVLSAGFALLATMLAATGLYGVLSYSVVQRTRELGLHQALGATPRLLERMVLGQVGRMAVVGGTVGLVSSVALGRASEALLFGLAGYDPAVLAGAVVVLSVVVFSAGLLPARRAARIPPMEALRHE